MEDCPFLLYDGKADNIRIINVDGIIDGDKRIDIDFFAQHQDDRTLFSYKGIKFCYSEGNLYLRVMQKGKPVFYRSGGKNRVKCRMSFFNEDGNQQEVIFNWILVDERAGNIKDAIFYHEVRELFYRITKHWCDEDDIKKAHNEAKKDEKKYIERFYDDALKRELKNFVDFICVGGVDPGEFGIEVGEIKAKDFLNDLLEPD